MLKKQSAKHTQNRALEWQNFCCYFFATPTRLAAGLGTKDYPRGSNSASPLKGCNTPFNWFPRAVRTVRKASVINFSTLIRLPQVPKGFKKNLFDGLFCGENLVKHQINHYTRDRNVQPDRINKPGQPPMLVKLALQGPP